MGQTVSGLIKLRISELTVAKLQRDVARQLLGPRFEENFRRAMLISRGDLAVFVERPISAVFIAICVILIGGQIYFRLRGAKAGPAVLHAPAGDEPNRWPEQAVPAEPGLLAAGASRLSARRLRGKLMLAVVALGLAAAIGFGLHHAGGPGSLDLSAQKKIQAQPPR